MSVLLLVSMFVFLHQVLPVHATGTIYIMPDGSVYPPTAPIQRSGDLYTFTSNITSEATGIVVERDGIELDGAGYTIHGNYTGPFEAGILIVDRTNVTLRNIRVERFEWGIQLVDSEHSTIANNSLSHNVYAMILNASSNNRIVKNNITETGAGIFMYSSSNCTIVENDLWHWTEMLIGWTVSLEDACNSNNVSCNNLNHGGERCAL